MLDKQLDAMMKQAQATSMTDLDGYDSNAIVAHAADPTLTARTVDYFNRHCFGQALRAGLAPAVHANR